MRKEQLIFFIVTLLLGVSSCTIEKRLYRNGFYFNRPGGNETADARTNEKPVSVEDLTVNETIAEKPVTTDDSARVVVQTDTSATAQKVNQQRREIPERVFEKPSTKNHTAARLIEPDKKQAVGAGIACALFFVLGMVGLIIKGTAMPVGIFIGAAFFCCILCMILAAFLYPRETEVKQPKESAAPLDPVAKIGIGFAIAIILLGFTFIVLWLSIFTGLFI